MKQERTYYNKPFYIGVTKFLTNLEAIIRAKENFGKILEDQLVRVEQLKTDEKWIDYKKLDSIRIGVVGGDGIGPTIIKEGKRMLEFILKDEIKAGSVEIIVIEGLTIENRVKAMKSIPDDTLAEIKRCHVILKGPTTTPSEGDPWPNIESANVALRRELDLFANIRPIKIPTLGIDWIFFRENTEGAYILGSKGINVTDDLAIDFKITTTTGSERIVKLAFEYARKNHINKVTVVTKANVVKTTDGKFLNIAEKVSKHYPEVFFEHWFIDIIAAKLLDSKRRTQFRIIVLPNLYGDIITDEAAELQGGVGTAGSANIGKKYSMFEAIHGSAPRMVEEQREKYADPSSILRASGMLLRHIGFDEKALELEMALDICCFYEKKGRITGRSDGMTASNFTRYVLRNLTDPYLKSKWQRHLSCNTPRPISKSGFNPTKD